MTVEIRALQPDDRDAWDPLWQAYLVFYEEDLPPAVTEVTWARFHRGDEPLWAIGAWEGGRLVGISHHLFHRSTWSPTTSCYLEDLYAVPEVRGTGVGRALIEFTAQRAIAAGADKLYWQTQATNATARKLYDRAATDRGAVVYERDLP